MAAGLSVGVAVGRGMLVMVGERVGIEILGMVVTGRLTKMGAKD